MPQKLARTSDRFKDSKRSFLPTSKLRKKGASHIHLWSCFMLNTLTFFLLQKLSYDLSIVKGYLPQPWQSQGQKPLRPCLLRQHWQHALWTHSFHLLADLLPRKQTANKQSSLGGRTALLTVVIVEKRVRYLLTLNTDAMRKKSLIKMNVAFLKKRQWFKNYTKEDSRYTGLKFTTTKMTYNFWTEV